MQAREIADLQRPDGHLVLTLLAGDETGGGVAGGEAGVRWNVLDADDDVGRDVEIGDRRLEVDGDATQFAFAGFPITGRLRFSEGLHFTHGLGMRRSCWEPGCCVVGLRLTKVGKAGVKVEPNSSA